MNLGRRLVQLSRGVLRQQTQRRNMRTQETTRTPQEDVKEKLKNVNKEGIMLAKGILAAAMLWTIGRCAWLNYHVLPLTTEFEDEKAPPTFN